MDEIDNYNAMECIAIGHDVKSIVCDWLECDISTPDDQIDRLVYKYTDCGAWLKFTETGIQLGTIVEGSEAEFSQNLDYPFTADNITEVVQWLEGEAATEWEIANNDATPDAE